MTPDQRRLYRQEVEELTAFLRGDPAWEALRRALRRRRVSSSFALLAAFTEDEFGVEYGALVTAGGRVIEYSRRVGGPGGRPRMLAWRDRTGDPGLLREYPQVAVALETRPA